MRVVIFFLAIWIKWNMCIAITYIKVTEKLSDDSWFFFSIKENTQKIYSFVWSRLRFSPKKRAELFSFHFMDICKICMTHLLWRVSCDTGCSTPWLGSWTNICLKLNNSKKKMALNASPWTTLKTDRFQYPLF